MRPFRFSDAALLRRKRADGTSKIGVILWYDVPPGADPLDVIGTGRALKKTAEQLGGRIGAAAEKVRKGEAYGL